MCKQTLDEMNIAQQLVAMMSLLQRLLSKEVLVGKRLSRSTELVTGVVTQGRNFPNG
jgi:hypothetical protein